MRNSSSSDKNKQYFNTDHLKTDLKSRSVKSGAVTIVSQVTKFTLQMGSTAVLGRLLVPEDYGLFGMVTIVTSFALLFNDLGLSAATVQNAEINHKQVSNLFWINIAISFITTSVVAALAPAIAWFYNEPRLIGMTLALSINFIFGGLAAQHSALLRRQMRFTILGQLDILSMLVGVGTAIVCAWYGLGYWSLVYMQWASLATTAIGVWAACGWRPGLPVRRGGIGSMLAFGRDLTGFRIVNYFTRNLDNLLIGRYWGPQELGLYAKAYQLLLLPMQQISYPVTNVALPALSHLQSEPERYRSFYCKAILLITSIGMPIVGFMFSSADKVILILLGRDWLGAVDIFRFLMPAAFVDTYSVATGWVYQSLGRTDRQFRWGLIMSSITAIIFIVSVQWGAIGVAAGFGISRPILQLPSVIHCYKGTPLRLMDLVKSIYRPALASLGAMTLLIGFNQIVLTNFHLLLELLIDFVVYSLFYISIWMVLPQGRETFLEIVNLKKSLKTKS
jgi:O-antigen/teichoic acid export membrane protein